MKRYRFKLNQFDKDDNYIDELRTILNYREFFYKYDRYNKIGKFIAIFSFLFYTVFFLYIVLYNDTISDNFVMFSVGYTIFVTIFFVLVQPIWTIRLEKLLTKTIYDEIDTNPTLKKWYDNYKKGLKI